MIFPMGIVTPGFRGRPEPVPGPTTNSNKVKEGREGKKGKKGRREEGKERSFGTDDGWIDGHRREQDIELREGWGEDKMRRGKGTKESDGQLCFQFVLLITHGEG
jgi:hypothetical protein